MNTKLIGWAVAASVFVLASHIGCTPKRSDDVRVALMAECPVSKGSTETGAAGVNVAVAVGEALAGNVVRTAAQLAKVASQAHSSVPISGVTADYFYVTDGKGNLHANLTKWRCLVVLVKDLRSAPAGSTDKPPRDDYDAYPVFLEAALQFSADRTALEFKPVTLRYRAPLEGTVLGSEARDLTVQISLFKPGVKEPFATTAIEFKSLLPGPTQELRIDALGATFAKRSGWLPALAVDDGIKLALSQEAARARDASTGAAASSAEGAAVSPRASVQGPTSIVVSIVESREGSILWKLLGDTLEGVLPALFNTAPTTADKV